MVVRRCALAECGRQIVDRQATGRPRYYCQVSCRRRAQYLRDLARKAKREGLARPSRAPGRAEVSEGRRLFGQALTHLFRNSGLAVRDVTRLTRIRSDRFRAMLNGEVVPAWSTTFMLVTVVGGSPCDFQWFWQWARGGSCGPMSRDDAGHQLQAALRGLRLAAAETCSAAGEETALNWRGDGQEQARLLDDWEQVSQLIERFGVSAERFQPLWDMARRAALRDLGRDEVREGAMPGAS